MTKNKNLHLATSVVIITIVAVAYGLYPDNVVPEILDFKAGSADLKQLFRATMGLYLGMVLLWITGIVKPAYWRSATIANVFFMLGLATGRIISLLIDGMPSVLFTAGLAVELILGSWGTVNLKKYNKTRA